MTAWFCKALGGLLALLLVALFVPEAASKPASQFTPPANITVTMYELIDPGGALPDNPVRCSSGNVHFGCTAFVGDTNHPYPYTDNPVTVLIEKDYLLDVVPKELGAYYHSTALQAQAIAARSYVYFKIDNNLSIDNSASNNQAFIPYWFERQYPETFPADPNDPCNSAPLNESQRLVCAAVAPRYYISYGIGSNADRPAFTEFTADVYYYTHNHPRLDLYPYLMGVADFISFTCDADDDGVNLAGMSGEGASRWARGNLCSYAGTGDAPWNVTWTRSEQILVHYYTGIHIRDANRTALTYAYRWNPLQITWGTPNNQPPIMCHGITYSMAVRVQNTGIDNWSLSNGQWGLSYHWAKAGFGERDSNNRVWATVDVPRGDPPYNFASLIINDIPDWGPGIYTLKLDMVHYTLWHIDEWFSGIYHWPTYNVSIYVDDLCYLLPVLMKNYAGW